MIGKKINELATELAPLSTDLTIIGDPTTGVSKKITLEQISSLFGGSVSFYTNLAGFPAVGNIDIIYCAKDTNKLYLWSGSAYVEMFPSQALLDTYQLRSEKGNANGYASLDNLGKVPISQLPSSLMEYKGMWNAATNTPTLANGTGDTGDVYICNVAGTVNFGAGPITFAVGDYVIYSGTIWQRSSGAVGTVTSVAATITGDSLTISGSPVTTSGTLAFTFNGTTAQYIRGNGTLATFPSLTGFVPYTGATTNVNLGTYSLSAYDLIINHTSGSGVAASITKGGNGEALTVVKSSGTGNAASITGGVTLLDELHLNTDLADAYIASATNWNAAYNDKINSAAVTGTTTKTLTLTQQDGGTITASWTDDNTDAVTSVFGRTGAVVAVSGDYTTSLVTEGTNLYFTNARAIASTLTGYTSGAGTITSSDSILSAIQKLNGNIGALTTGVSSVNGLTGAVTLTTSNIAEGTNLYYTEARVNANTNVAANTAARHNAVTIGTANGLSLSTQVLSLGLASTSTTGALSSTDWNTFNNKTSNTGTVTSVGLSSATSGVTIGSTPITTSGTITLAIATASGSQQGLLSSTDWTTFNNKQNALTNPVTGTGTTNYLPKFTGASTIGNSQIFDNGTNVGIGTDSPDTLLHLSSTTDASILRLERNSVSITSGQSYGQIQWEGQDGSTGAAGVRGSIDVVSEGTLGQVKMVFRTSTSNFNANLDRLTIDSGGNLGLGVTPSAWSIGKALDIDSGSVGIWGYLNESYYTNNSYFNGGWKYKVSSAANQYILLDNGGHIWRTAPSGTAGNAISFTQAMTLDASGRLGIGTTSLFTRFTSATTNTRLEFDEVNSTTAYLEVLNSGRSATNYFNIYNRGLNVFTRNGGSGASYVQSFTLAETGAATFSSSVTATNEVRVKTASTSGVGLSKDSSGAYLYNIDNTFMAFGTNNTERMRITSGGNVGIGTTTINERLDVEGNQVLRNSGTYSTSLTRDIIYRSSTASFGIQPIANIQFATVGDAASEIRFVTRANAPNYGTRMTINSVGNVGIGTTSPNDQLEVAGNTSSAFRVRINNASASGGETLIFTSGTTIKSWVEFNNSTNNFDVWQYTNNALRFGTNNTERMRITSGGNVGIGTTSPSTKLEVNGAIKTGDPGLGSAGAIKLGQRFSGTAIIPSGYIPIDIDGTTYYINLFEETP